METDKERAERWCKDYHALQDLRTQERKDFLSLTEIGNAALKTVDRQREEISALKNLLNVYLKEK